MTAKLVKPITCRKCKGSGTFSYVSGMLGTCSSCCGEGVVEGDKATNAAHKAAGEEYRRIYPILLRLANSSFRTAGMLLLAYDALPLLKKNEPTRYAKAVASIEAGHPGVVKALAEYYQANR
jgi:hypothetical protein